LKTNIPETGHNLMPSISNAGYKNIPLLPKTVIAQKAKRLQKKPMQ
jgi:hypothetical protein